MYVFDGGFIFAHGYSQRGKPHGTAAELIEDGFEQTLVHFIETVFININHAQCCMGHFGGDAAIGFHLGVVAHPAEQGIGHSGCTA